MTEFTLDLTPGQVGLVGYGSLISRASLERTLGRRYDGPLHECAIPGWRRRWDVAMPNARYFAERPTGRLYPARILYLNVGPAAGSTLNGVLFVVTAAELAAFDRREWIYDRADVTGLVANGRVADGPAFMYVGKAEHLVRLPSVPAEVGLRATYLGIVEAGLAEQADDFRRRYRDSTDDPPYDLVIEDRLEEAG